MKDDKEIQEIKKQIRSLNSKLKELEGIKIIEDCATYSKEYQYNQHVVRIKVLDTGNYENPRNIQIIRADTPNRCVEYLDRQISSLQSLRDRIINEVAE